MSPSQTDTADTHPSGRSERYLDAMRKLETNELRQPAAGHALMASAMSFGGWSLSDKGKVRGTAKIAQLFCIAAAFLIPNLLLMYLLATN